MESRVIITSTVNRSKDKHGIVHINQYTLHKTLGEGGFAIVKLAKSQDNFYVNMI